MSKALSILDYEPGTKIMKPGLYRMPLSVYHSDCAWKESTSSGDNFALSENGEEWWKDSYYNPVNQTEKRQIKLHKECFRFGTAAHTKILEPQKWIEEYVPWPSKWKTMRSEDAKYWRWVQETQKGMTTINLQDVAKVDAMARRIKEHTLASTLFEVGEPEISLFIEDECGTVIKSRPDMLPIYEDKKTKKLRIADNIFSDYKTCFDNSPDACNRQIEKMGYDVKLACCALVACRLLGFNFGDLDFALVFQKTEDPYGITVIELGNDYMHKLAAKALYGAQQFARGRAPLGGQWDGYTDEIVKYNPPGYSNRTEAKLDDLIAKGILPNLDNKMRLVK